MAWQPIKNVPLSVVVNDETIIVWVPEFNHAVSAAPYNPAFADDESTVIGWDGDPLWSMTDCCGGSYMLELDHQPTHFWSPLPTPPS